MGETEPSEEARGVSRANLRRIRPVLRILSYDEAVAYYVDWLGFKIEWEWREAPGKPVIMEISRDGVDIHLVEGGDRPPTSWVQFALDDMVSLVEELNAKRPDSVSFERDFPYIQEISMDDPFGNHLVFQKAVTAEERQALDERAEQMRVYIRERLAAGHDCPTPEEAAEALRLPVTFSTKVQASSVLGEFPEYAEAASEE
jgi:catechol 2,3-dioxygenase-like lactoylglutathione lyase family enzyme